MTPTAPSARTADKASVRVMFASPLGPLERRRLAVCIPLVSSTADRFRASTHYGAPMISLLVVPFTTAIAALGLVATAPRPGLAIGFGPMLTLAPVAPPTSAIGSPLNVVHGQRLFVTLSTLPPPPPND